MAKQQVYTLKNGATFVYQKQSAFNGYTFSIGFRSGAQLDGKYKGLSHLLEHLLFRTPNPKSTSTLLDNIVKYNINQNAYTSVYDICAEFSSVLDNVDFALETIINMFTRKTFTQEQIDQEIEIVKREIAMSKNSEQYDDLSALDQLIGSLMEDTPDQDLDILGNARTLKQITPELLSEYVKRYFNLDNLIVSVTTNQSLESALTLCNEHIFSKLKNAKNKKYIVSPPPAIAFKPSNLLLALPNEYMCDTSIDLVVRVRDELREDINKEYAYDIMEEYIINEMGGLLWKRLREKNQLVYLYGLSTLNYETGKFKVFSATTKPSKLRKVTAEIGALISELANGGVSKKTFNSVKKVLVDLNTARLNKFESASASSNYQKALNQDYNFVDYKKVQALIAKMTYEDFCDHLSQIYYSPNVSLAVEGDFDSRKCYTLLEVEKMVGNYSHVEQRADFNQPRIETSDLVDMASLTAEQLTLFLQSGVFDEEPKETAVKIDNEIVK